MAWKQFIAPKSSGRPQGRQRNCVSIWRHGLIYLNKMVIAAIGWNQAFKRATIYYDPEEARIGLHLIHGNKKVKGTYSVCKLRSGPSRGSVVISCQSLLASPSFHEYLGRAYPYRWHKKGRFLEISLKTLTVGRARTFFQPNG